MAQTVQDLDCSKIVPNPRQPRTSFNRERLEELAESIKVHGLLEPIVVRKQGLGYQIVCGERRWRAVQLVNLKTIPAIVKDTSDENILVESLIENIHREDLTSIERENAIKVLWDTGKYKTQVELGKVLGYKSDTRISALLGAIEFREKYLSDKNSAVEEVSTRTIIDTSGLRDDLRADIVKGVAENKIKAEDVQKLASEIRKAPENTQKAIIEKVASEEIPLKDLSSYIEDLKKAPEPVRKAIIENKVDYEDVKPHISTIETRPEVADQFVEEFVQRKEEKEAERKANIERTDAIIKQEITPIKTVVNKSLDEKLYKEFDEIYVKIHYWQWFNVTAIGDLNLRRQTVIRLQGIRDHVDALLKELEKQGITGA